jgi:hypothetical protein
MTANIWGGVDVGKGEGSRTTHKRRKKENMKTARRCRWVLTVGPSRSHHATTTWGVAVNPTKKKTKKKKQRRKKKKNFIPAAINNFFFPWQPKRGEVDRAPSPSVAQCVMGTSFGDEEATPTPLFVPFVVSGGCGPSFSPMFSSRDEPAVPAVSTAATVETPTTTTSVEGSRSHPLRKKIPPIPPSPHPLRPHFFCYFFRFCLRPFDPR